MPVVEVRTPTRQANRNSTDTQDLSSLSATLTRVQHIASTSTVEMARKIGFTVGTELASDGRKPADVDSELTVLFRRLSLGKVSIRQWGPVVFATHHGSSDDPQTAFGEGVLEGVMHARSNDRVFFRHSTTPVNSHGNACRHKTQGRSRKSEE